MVVRKMKRSSSGGTSSTAGMLAHKGGIMQEVAEEGALIAAALIAVSTLYVTRALWFPASALESVLVVHPSQCHISVGLNSNGAVEGPWLNATWTDLPPQARGALIPQKLVEQGKLVALTPGSDDGTLRVDHLTEGLEAWGGRAREDAVTLAFARLAERYLSTWLSIDGVRSGLGKRGLVKELSLRAMSSNVKLAPCIANMRIVGGRVYFRYGSFLQCSRKLRRLNLMVRTIQKAITKYHLQGLKAELYVNVCDAPQSYDNSLSAGKSGFAVFSTQLTPGSTDILCPDPMDLLALAQTPTPLPVAWSSRQSKAVWRGEGFEMDLKTTNWASSFRLRLHRMSDVRPDLLDARVTMWGPRDRGDAKNTLVRNGVILGAPMPREQQQKDFKYTLVVDEAVGTRDMCAALSGPQAIIRHASGFTQYFDPLLLPGVHYMPVRHSLADLFDAVEWMKANDASVQEMVRNANEVAPLLCTEEAQVHFWAVLLAKYSARAMENPEAVVAPKVCKRGKALVSSSWANEKTPPTCKLPGNSPCSDFCVEGKEESEWTWLDSDVVEDVAELLAVQ